MTKKNKTTKTRQQRRVSIEGNDVPTGARTVAGVASGALLGFAVGGPAGAALGCFTGFIIGATSDMEAYRNQW